MHLTGIDSNGGKRGNYITIIITQSTFCFSCFVFYLTPSFVKGFDPHNETTWGRLIWPSWSKQSPPNTRASHLATTSYLKPPVPTPKPFSFFIISITKPNVQISRIQTLPIIPSIQLLSNFLDVCSNHIHLSP